MLAEFTITPGGRSEHYSQAIADILRIVDGSGLPYELHAMGTIIEGDWDDVMAVIHKCHEAMLRASPRVALSIRIDDYPGRAGMLESKVAKVEAMLGHKLRRSKSSA